MKKIISVIISVLMLVMVSSSFLTAYAADDFYSIETTVKHIDITVTLNGEHSHNTSYVPDKENDKVFTFTYTGDGTLIGWDFDYNDYPLVEGIDYIILNQDGNSITIEILGGYTGDNFWVNAVDDLSDTTRKENNSQKSPDTGVSFIGYGLIIAGSAVIVASRKKR